MQDSLPKMCTCIARLEGLATVIRGWVDQAKLAKAMKLAENQKILLAQTVGYPRSK